MHHILSLDQHWHEKSGGITCWIAREPRKSQEEGQKEGGGEGEAGAAGQLVPHHLDLPLEVPVHAGRESGVLDRVGAEVGDGVTLSVDYSRRAPIAKNHTATHMVNLAIKDTLKQACDQRGSLCDAEKLRFDFAYDKPLSEKELRPGFFFRAVGGRACLPSGE